MKNTPRVSVIVPVFNTKAYLGECLTSLVEQTLPDMEIIVVDNGSTDGSFEFAQHWASRHPDVRVLRHPDGRQGAARNAGLDVAGGKYIGFVDSDDWVIPTAFEQMFVAAEESGAEVVVCNYRVYEEGKGETRPVLPAELLVQCRASQVADNPKLLRNLMVCNKLYSRKLLESNSIRFPEGVFHEDQFFVTLALLLAKRIATLPKPLYFYRKGRPGSVNEKRGRDALDVFQVMDLLEDFLRRNVIQNDLGSMVGEVQALKYMQVYRLVGPDSRAEYFREMKSRVSGIPIPNRPRLLSHSEARELRFVQRHGRLAHSCFLSVRRVYGWGRRKAIRDRRFPELADRTAASRRGGRAR